MNNRLLIFILLFFSLAFSQETCSQSWLSDGNYYDYNECYNKCASYNEQQNKTQTSQEAISCCKPICQSQVSYHTTKRIVIIVVASVLFVLVILCFLYGCYGPSFKQSYVLKKQRKKRIAQQVNTEYFEKCKKEFQNMLTQGQKDKWNITFNIPKNNSFKSQKMYLHYIKFSKIKDSQFQYEVYLQGQDLNGLWTSKGYFLNSSKGITIWGLKDYQNAENKTIFFQQLSQIVHELVRKENGEYEGQWWRRKSQNSKNSCFIKKANQNIKNNLSINNNMEENDILIDAGNKND